MKSSVIALTTQWSTDVVCGAETYILLSVTSASVSVTQFDANYPVVWDIANCTFDGYLTSFAQQVKTGGRSFTIRTLHEQNGKSRHIHVYTHFWYDEYTLA